MERILLASGCFWSKEYFFQRLPGVVATRVGFSGGHTPNPTYQQVCTKTTGHAEVVEVHYDPSILPLEVLLHHFFAHHNPTIDRRDRGGQYRSAIFYTTDAQRATTERLLQQLRENGYAAVTEVAPATPFYPAGERHQQYCDTRGMVPRAHEGVPLAFWEGLPDPMMKLN